LGSICSVSVAISDVVAVSFFHVFELVAVVEEEDL